MLISAKKRQNSAYFRLFPGFYSFFFKKKQKSLHKNKKIEILKIYFQFFFFLIMINFVNDIVPFNKFSFKNK
jgi:hypothetical protein